MKNLGLRGILMLVVFSGVTSLLLRWGGGWEIFGRILVSILAVVLGGFGVYKILVASFSKEPQRCYFPRCGEAAHRYCDFRTIGDDTCGRWACHGHMHISGKHDYCQGHYEQEGL